MPAWIWIVCRPLAGHDHEKKTDSGMLIEAVDLFCRMPDVLVGADGAVLAEGRRVRCAARGGPAGSASPGAPRSRPGCPPSPAACRRRPADRESAPRIASTS